MYAAKLFHAPPRASPQRPRQEPAALSTPNAVVPCRQDIGVVRRLLDGGAMGGAVPAIRTTKVRAGRLVGVGLAGLSAAQAFSFPGGAQKRP